MAEDVVLFYQCNSILGVSYVRIYASFLQEWSKMKHRPITWCLVHYELEKAVFISEREH